MTASQFLSVDYFEILTNAGAADKTMSFVWNSEYFVHIV